MGMINNIGSWMLNRIVGESTADDDDNPENAGTSSRPLSPTAQLVGEGVYEDDMIDVQIPAPASSHFERYRKLIDSFDEDRESPLEKIVRWFFLGLSYLLPLDGWSLGTHTVAMAGEFALAMMTLSCATALRKMTTDASYAPKFVGSLVSFLLFSLASGLAQWFIALLHVGGLHNTAGLAALIFRVAMVPAVDVASLLFLAVMNFKSLKKFVADQRVRAQAIRDINEAELEIQRAQSAASRRETEERQDLQMKDQRNQVWLELDRLHAQSMISDAKRRALPSATVTPEDALPGSAADVPMIEQIKVRRIERTS